MFAKRIAALMMLVAALGLTGAAWANNAGTVLAKVDGTKITQQQVKALLASRGVQKPSAQQMKAGLNLYIERMLVLRQAQKQNFLKGQAGLRQHLREQELNSVAQAMLEHVAQSRSISSASVQQAYKEYVRQLPDKEYRVRVIVVQHRKEAEKILDELKNGKRFSDLAAQHSQSQFAAQRGGELGWKSLRELQPRVGKLLRQLDPGQVGGPRWTPQGWWIVQLLQTRSVNAPPLKAVKVKLMNHLRAQAQQKYLHKLMQGAKIEYVHGAPPKKAKSAPGAQGNHL